jgi:O-antigen/teichoic acid export membrane protein
MLNKIIKNTAFQLIGGVAAKIIGMLFVIVASRSLGTEGYGKYSFIFTFTSFFSMMASFGVPTIATRELAKNPDDRGRILGDIIILKLVLGFVSVLFCLVFGKILGYGADLQLGFKIVCIGLLFSFLDSYRALFQATMQMHYNMYSSVLHDALLLLSALYLAFIRADFVSFVWAGLGCTLVSNMLLTHLGYRLVKPSFSFNKKRLAKLFLESFPLGMASFVVYIYYNADSIMLSKMATMAAVGYYAVAYKFVFMGQMIPQALVTSLFPGFSHDVVHDKKRAEGILELSFRLFGYVAFGLLILGTLYHRNVITLLFGEKYLGASAPLLIFSLSFIFMLPNILFSKYLVAANRQKFIFYVHLASAALNVALNFYAIPRFGAAGAAATTMLSDMLVFAAFFSAVSKNTEYVKLKILVYLKLALLGAGLIVAGLLLNINWYVEALLIGCIFIGYIYSNDKTIVWAISKIINKNYSQ